MGKFEERDYSKYPESDVVVEYIANRFKKGLYTLTLVWGLPGTGKSSTCIRLGELTSIKLNGENKLKKEDIVDSLIQLLKKIQESKPGDIIIIEEVSVLFPSRRSMAHENVSMSRILDTCRKKRIIIFSNAPIYGSVDKHIRCMAHVGIECLKIVKQQKVVVHKPIILQTNPSSGETYRHRFKRNGSEVHRTYTRMPNEQMWNDYEEQKDKFIIETYNRLLKQAEKKDEKLNKQLGIDKEGPRLQVRPLTKKELETHELVNIKKLTQTEAAKILNINVSCVSRRIKNINNKTQIYTKTKCFDSTTSQASDIKLVSQKEKNNPLTC